MAVVTKLDKLVALAKEKSSERRRALLREVTDLFFDEPPEQGTAVSNQFDDVLSALAEQAAREARVELSERFSGADMAPRGLILKLAQDAVEVAAPILSQSAVLTDADLLNLAEEAGQGHLRAISQRDSVPERVSEAIVRRGDDDTVATLIRNDGARLSRSTFEEVTVRAEHSAALQEPLVDRQDTPADLLNDLMVVVETHLRDRIAERFDDMDPEVLDAAMKASKARFERRVKEDKAIEEAKKYIASMAVRRQLDGALLVRLLREKSRARFIVGFSELTGVDLVAARRAIDQVSVDPLALICKAAGFEKALFVTLAVLRGDDTDGAFAEARNLGGVYDALTLEDAERAIRFWRMRRDMAA